MVRITWNELQLIFSLKLSIITVFVVFGFVCFFKFCDDFLNHLYKIWLHLSSGVVKNRDEMNFLPFEVDFVFKFSLLNIIY